MKLLLRFVVATLSLVVLIFVVLKGYDYSWTGFGSYEAPNDTAKQGKTLWDWLDLLIVPVVLAVGAYLLDGSRKKTDRLIEKDRQQQQVLDSFIDYVSELVLERDLHGSDVADHVRDLARTRALSALRLLDGRRKSQLVQFLYESRLIDKQPVIRLTGADLTDVVLDEATLRQTEIRGAYLNHASIRRAYLMEADLRGSDFSRADFSGSDLTNANLAQANLAGCKFGQAVFANTDVSGAELDRDTLTDEQRNGLIEG